MTWAGQMAQSRTGQDKLPKAGRPAQGRTSGSSGSIGIMGLRKNNQPRPTASVDYFFRPIIPIIFNFL